MMERLWHTLTPGPAAPDLVSVVVEIAVGPRAGSVQQNTNTASPPEASSHLPGDYGFIPQTFYTDRNPLEVLALTTIPTIPGSVFEARPVGLLRIQGQSHRDDMVIAVRTSDPHVAAYHDCAELPPHVRRAVEQWAGACHGGRGAGARLLGWQPAAVAREWIAFAAAYYSGLFGATRAREAHT